MRIFGDIDDVTLPVGSVNDALIKEKINLQRISILSDSKAIEQTDYRRKHDLFLMTPGFHRRALSTGDARIETIFHRGTVILILRQSEFQLIDPNPPQIVGWVFSDLPIDRLRSSLMIAGYGISLYPSGAGALIRANNIDASSVFSMDQRECAVLLHVSNGHSDSAIARILGIPPVRVKQITSSLYGKIGVRKRAEAGAFYHRFREEILAHRAGLLKADTN